MGVGATCGRELPTKLLSPTMSSAVDPLSMLPDP